MKNLDTKDRAALTRSLTEWKKRLHAEAVKHGYNPGNSAIKARLAQAHAMVARREKQIRALTGPRRRCIDVALADVGTTESPPGSNRGAKVSAYQKPFGLDGQPWCGSFVGHCIEKAGGNITARIVFTPYIYEDAVAGRNGLEGVAWRDGFHRGKVAHTASIVLFDFGSGGIKHTGLLRKPWNGHGPLLTVEGNTSFGNAGSQSNGGAVAMRERDVSLVHSIVNWKA